MFQMRRSGNDLRFIKVQKGSSRFKNVQEGPRRSMSVLKDALVLSALHNRNVRSLPNAV